MSLKSVLPFSILIVLLLSLNQPIVLSASYINVDVSQAREMIGSNPNLVILDVRTWEEYIGGHIKNAILIPVGELEGRLDELDSQKPTLVYCRSGGRSATASQILIGNGFIEVYNLLGGIMAWISAGYPVEMEVSKGYGTLQGAINTANEGDTIFIHSGTYYEHIVVNKTVSLMGEDPETTLINGNGTQTVLKIVNHNVNVTRLAIQNGYLGVYLTDGADSCIITDCETVNNSVGIFVRSDNNLLTKNIVVNNSESGVEIFADCGCSPVQGNIVTENNLLNNSYGIWLVNSVGGLIYHNNFVDNTHQVFTSGSYASWDDGYPSGGNYWSNYTGMDEFSGPYQNKAGYDWIGDTPHIIDRDNQDDYPLIDLYVPERQETRVTYRNLLRGYNELMSDFYSLNSTYSAFIADYDYLNSTYDTLLSNYSELQGNYTSLQISYNSLQGLFDSLNYTYTSLMDEVNNIQNLTYVFIATTVVFHNSYSLSGNKDKIVQSQNVTSSPYILFFLQSYVYIHLLSSI